MARDFQWQKICTNTDVRCLAPKKANEWQIFAKDRALTEALRVLQHGGQLGGKRRLALNLPVGALRESERQRERERERESPGCGPAPSELMRTECIVAGAQILSQSYVRTTPLLAPSAAPANPANAVGTSGPPASATCTHHCAPELMIWCYYLWRLK